MVCLRSLMILFFSVSVTCTEFKEGFCRNASQHFRDVEMFFNRTTCPDLSYDQFCTLDDQTQNWFHSLYREAMSEMTKGTPPRIRREIRTLTESERNKYFNAINALKNDQEIKPNKYDALAMVHSNQTICSAHSGTNFLGWHRVYLLIYETALRQKDNSVSLPYWDSVIDNNNITAPSSTIIFTDAFLGNSDGFVVSGPFANWRDSFNCSLIREVSDQNNKTLMSPEIIYELQHDISLHHAEQVFYNGIDGKYTIEGQHGLPHRWVGGTMEQVDTASHDPIFFMHHAFIDYIWELFRSKQELMHVDSETDYPVHGRDKKRHLPDRLMDCFYWVENIDGLSKNFSRIVKYESSPSCPTCDDSPYLTCNIRLNRCVAKQPEVTLPSDSTEPGKIPTFQPKRPGDISSSDPKQQDNISTQEEENAANLSCIDIWITPLLIVIYLFSVRVI